MLGQMWLDTYLPVSVLNVVLNVGVVCLAWLAHEFGISTARRLIAVRLQKTARAPMILEVDHKFLEISQGFKRAVRERSIAPILIFALTSSLIVMEIFSEYGVDSSNFCRPQRLGTKIGICAETRALLGTVTKNVALISKAQGADWRFPNSGAVVRQGFRKRFNGRESFHSEQSANKSNPVVIGDCTVSPVEIIPAGEATVEVLLSSTGKSNCDEEKPCG